MQAGLRRVCGVVASAEGRNLDQLIPERVSSAVRATLEARDNSRVLARGNPKMNRALQNTRSAPGKGESKEKKLWRPPDQVADYI